uniref:Uncharacterized protein n=1 Tax=Tetraselmis sp. GSL018 TaxID=582737 RepID=A0A061RFR1_9CHLO
MYSTKFMTLVSGVSAFLGLLNLIVLGSKLPNELLICNGEPSPLLSEASTYTVKFRGPVDFTPDSVVTAAVSVLQDEASKGSAVFELKFRLRSINAIIAEMDGSAISTLAAEYGDNIDYIECDSAVYAISESKIVCGGGRVAAVPSGETDYIISAAGREALGRVSAAISRLGATWTPASAVSGSDGPHLLRSRLGGEAARSLLSSARADISYMQCADDLDGSAESPAPTPKGSGGVPTKPPAEKPRPGLFAGQVNLTQRRP